eukprot:2949-Heterococcus_DN1.PRE.1
MHGKTKRNVRTHTEAKKWLPDYCYYYYYHSCCCCPLAACYYCKLCLLILLPPTAAADAAAAGKLCMHASTHVHYPLYICSPPGCACCTPSLCSTAAAAAAAAMLSTVDKSALDFRLLLL